MNLESIDGVQWPNHQLLCFRFLDFTRILFRPNVYKVRSFLLFTVYQLVDTFSCKECGWTKVGTYLSWEKWYLIVWSFQLGWCVVICKMNKTLDYGGNKTQENDEKHVRSGQSATQQSRYSFIKFKFYFSELNNFRIDQVNSIKNEKKAHQKYLEFDLFHVWLCDVKTFNFSYFSDGFPVYVQRSRSLICRNGWVNLELGIPVMLQL